MLLLTSLEAVSTSPIPVSRVMATASYVNLMVSSTPDRTFVKNPGTSLNSGSALVSIEIGAGDVS